MTAVQRTRGVRQEKRERTRQKLIAATLDSLAHRGFAETTLAKVSERAEVSRGLVNFHFISKEQLLIETLQQLEQEYTSHWQKALANAGPVPVDRLRALVESDFHPHVCNRKKIAVWYSFLGEARSRPTYVDTCEKFDKQYAEQLTKCCSEVIVEGGYKGVDASLVARTLGSLIDSLWREFLLRPKHFDRVQARDLCMQYLACFFTDHF